MPTRALPESPEGNWPSSWPEVQCLGYSDCSTHCHNDTAARNGCMHGHQSKKHRRPSHIKPRTWAPRCTIFLARSTQPCISIPRRYTATSRHMLDAMCSDKGGMPARKTRPGSTTLAFASNHRTNVCLERRPSRRGTRHIPDLSHPFQWHETQMYTFQSQNSPH